MADCPSVIGRFWGSKLRNASGALAIEIAKRRDRRGRAVAGGEDARDRSSHVDVGLDVAAVHGSIRAQSAAYMMGQAAATAAVQSIRTGQPACIENGEGDKKSLSLRDLSPVHTFS